MFSLLLYFYKQRSANYVVVILLLVALLGESAALKPVHVKPLPYFTGIHLRI